MSNFMSKNSSYLLFVLRLFQHAPGNEDDSTRTGQSIDFIGIQNGKVITSVCKGAAGGQGHCLSHLVEVTSQFFIAVKPILAENRSRHCTTDIKFLLLVHGSDG